MVSGFDLHASIESKTQRGPRGPLPSFFRRDLDSARGSKGSILSLNRPPISLHSCKASLIGKAMLTKSLAILSCFKLQLIALVTWRRWLETAAPKEKPLRRARRRGFGVIIIGCSTSGYDRIECYIVVIDASLLPSSLPTICLASQRGGVSFGVLASAPCLLIKLHFKPLPNIGQLIFKRETVGIHRYRNQDHHPVPACASGLPHLLCRRHSTFEMLALLCPY